MCTVVTTIQELLSKVYPDIILINDKPIEWLCERTPKNDQAAAIYDILLMTFEGEEKFYTSIDTVANTDEATNYPVVILNLLKSPGEDKLEDKPKPRQTNRHRPDKPKQTFREKCIYTTNPINT